MQVGPRLAKSNNSGAEIKTWHIKADINQVMLTGVCMQRFARETLWLKQVCGKKTAVPISWPPQWSSWGPVLAETHSGQWVTLYIKCRLAFNLSEDMVHWIFRLIKQFNLIYSATLALFLSYRLRIYMYLPTTFSGILNPGRYLVFSCCSLMISVSFLPSTISSNTHIFTAGWNSLCSWTLTPTMRAMAEPLHG